ncbi:MAG TPA: hypothetical protein VLC09_00245 [Polyangiaceae bacterium]|nr:hypothetical protein [Polyangiaceae bacterium]
MTWLLVDDEAKLEQAVAELTGKPRLFIDTEFESNKSGQRLCLLQISAGERIFLIDPLRVAKPDPLRPLLGAPGVEWVLHAGLQDVHLVTDRLNVPAPSRLFDTQIAWALLSAESNVSLAYLQYKILSVRGSKAHQADDWLKRPLPDSQLRYAASDVERLPAMSDWLLARALEKNRVEAIYAASREALLPVREPAAPLELSAFRNAWQLEPKNQAALQFLIGWYNRLTESEQQDAPDTKTLLSMASRLPEDVEALGRIKGVHRGVVARHGRSLVSGMNERARSARADDFVPIEPPPYATFADVRLDAWLGTARAEICAELEVSPEFVLPTRVLREAKAALVQRGTAGLFAAFGGFRGPLLAEALQRFCERQPPPV